MTPEVPKALRTEIGMRIKAVRQAKGWSREDAAERFGVTVSAWGQWERGERLINLPAAIAFGLETEVPLDFIFVGDDRRLPLEIAQRILTPAQLFRSRGRN